MTITRFSTEGRLHNFLAEQGMAAEFFVALLPRGTVSLTRLRQALRGMSLRNDYHAPIDALIRELSALAAEYAPLRIRWEQPEKFRPILAARRDASRAPLNCRVAECGELGTFLAFDRNALLQAARI